MNDLNNINITAVIDKINLIKSKQIPDIKYSTKFMAALSYGDVDTLIELLKFNLEHIIVNTIYKTNNRKAPTIIAYEVRSKYSNNTEILIEFNFVTHRKKDYNKVIIDITFYNN